MKVLVITNMYPNKERPFYGIFVKEQVDSLLKLGLEIDVFFINGQKSKKKYITDIPKLVKLLNNNEYDLIHAHHTFCVLPAFIARYITKKKLEIVLTCHEGEVHLPDEVKVKSQIIKKIVFSKSLKLFNMNLADFVISVQDKIIEAIQYKKEVKIIPCGVDAEKFCTMDKASCKQKLNIDKDKKIIFFPADPMNVQKGVDVLKDAIDLIGRDDLVLITGGNINYKNMPIYMNAADVVVQLSLFEASPSVLKEALSVNATVVFTEAGDTKEVLGNTIGGFLCERNKEDVADKIEMALKQKDKNTGRQRIMNLGLSLETVAKSIIEVYKIKSSRR